MPPLTTKDSLAVLEKLGDAIFTMAVSELLAALLSLSAVTVAVLMRAMPLVLAVQVISAEAVAA